MENIRKFCHVGLSKVLLVRFVTYTYTYVMWKTQSFIYIISFSNAEKTYLCIKHISAHMYLAHFTILCKCNMYAVNIKLVLMLRICYFLKYLRNIMYKTRGLCIVHQNDMKAR